ncbi:MAG: hypothetical protein JWO06_1174, partial [Bacteroidota bacterium]|nr:hypothetical protein [Bacteroidota bacterium]
MGINLKRQNTSGTITSEAFEPFSEIAVSLSGGGFRAAAYTLGCLSYLQRRKYENVRLLERVKFITGASGGALTGILFSAHNHLGIPFSTTYARLRQDILMEDKILQEAVKVIADDKQWPRESLKRRNTINAFAKVYQKMVFDDLNFGLYWDKTKATVDEVCFSASELENGRTFRFQTDGKDETKEMIGNPYLRLTDKNTVGAKKMLLGDILAASSCAPGGFEPMIFPGDFATNREHLKDLEDTLVAAKNHDWEHYESFKRSFALMDGGITDNQGVEGLKLAHKRRKETKGKGYDLTLICDVANYFLDP